MTSYTPSASTERPAVAHEYAINGAYTSPAATITTLEVAPEILEKRTFSFIHNHQNVTIDRIVSEFPSNTQITDRLVFTIEGMHRTILVTRLEKGLLIDINHLRFRVIPASARQIIEIITQDGNDTVYIAANVLQPFHIRTGAGDDTVITSAGYTQVRTGDGNDRVITGDGPTYIETGKGDDVVNANGSGEMTVYTGQGDDVVRGAAGRCYIETGEGNDIAIGGEQHSIMSGGDGDDLLYAGTGTNALYTGLGDDAIKGLKYNDKAHSKKPVTHISNGTLTSTSENDAPSVPEGDVVNVDARSLASSGLIIQGSEAFIERVTDDLKLLLGSSHGKKLLDVLSKSIHDHKKPITIVEYKRVENGMYMTSRLIMPPWIQGSIAGQGNFGGTVYYNPAHQRAGSVPLASLYHELCHAYNYVTGTVFSGTSAEQLFPEMPPHQTQNSELQAIGLPAEVTPFDFDGDPQTPPTKTNPQAFSENGLLMELGLPLRKTHIQLASN